MDLLVQGASCTIGRGGKMTRDVLCVLQAGMDIFRVSHLGRLCHSLDFIWCWNDCHSSVHSIVKSSCFLHRFDYGLNCLLLVMQQLERLPVLLIRYVCFEAPLLAKVILSIAVCLQYWGISQWARVS